jgi:hypothetical protein
MIERRHLVELLKVNGLSAEATREEVSAVLKEASFSDIEIDEMFVSKDDEKTPSESDTPPISVKKKIFHRHDQIEPAEISKLLGVSVSVKEVIMTERLEEMPSFLQVLLFGVMSAFVAGTLILGYMFSEGIGVFHPSMQELTIGT